MLVLTRLLAYERCGLWDVGEAAADRTIYPRFLLRRVVHDFG
jgi:hypothetical protein